MPGLSAPPDTPPHPPVAKKQAKTTALHGVTLIDDYHWLRDKTDPDVTAYLEAENACTEAGTQHLAALRERLYREMLGRIKETDTNVPVRDGGYWYYTRTEEGQAYAIFCRRQETLDAPEQVYLDQNQLAAGQKFHAFGGIDVSPDGTTLLYLEDLTAFREYTLYVKDLTTGALLESIPNVWNGTAWADDSRTFFYVTPDAAKRGDTVWRHVIGTSRDQDVRVFHEPNPLYNVSVGRSRSDQYVFIAADGYTTSEWRAIPSAAPAAAPRVIALPNADGTVVVSARSSTSGPAGWAANGVSCTTACTNLGQTNCATAVCIAGTGATCTVLGRTVACSVTDQARLCQCY